ncbi:hypothetical protein F6V25_05745 [Oryzomonas japonica]|uniref:Uncharacterized protein n=1 Tax=Oryzomonas japonica TaxID=2603858 RepID=A0A7J4ZS01_9BACT|nr:hypothetical protein [Oryzomonas japonica]KAB0665982.1 hypothetical protein F6V25_05745 [Oryzomonas japonica]
MSIEFTQRETDLRRRLTAELNDEIKNHIESEINEQAEEIKNDLEYEYPDDLTPSIEPVLA